MPSITPNRASEAATQLSRDANKQVRSLRKMWLRVARKTVGGRVRRKLVCFALAVSLLILPGPGLPLNELPALASRAADATVTSVSYLPLVLRNLFGIFFSANPRPQNLAERIASVRELRISPHKLVGYVGDRVSFAGMGIDGDGQPAHGAKFEWESSDASKLEIDEAGGATLLRPGLVRVTCRAGSVSRSAPVQIRPTRRLLQTDSEWRADQDSLSETAAGPTGSKDALASLLDKLAPTARAQGNSPGDYPNATYPGHVGTPPLTALEDTRLGPVMPGTNFELPISLVNLGGRGLATSLTAYYNSNQWGAYVGPGGTTYVFDPIQSWPSPGFSLGFGRIVYYDPAAYYNPGNPSETGHRFMLIEANGTRHSLGIGSDYGSNTLQTTDGSHITYVGNAADGGALFYNAGTKVTIGKVNNRLLPTQITDTNGNYIQVAYKWETNFPGIAINYIVDTLGRVIQFNYGESPAPPGSTHLTSISTPTGSVTFGYQTVTMNHNFQNVIVENAPVSFPAVSSVTIPQRPTYSFNYSGYGMIYNISLATGGGNATVTYNYPLGGEELYAGPTFTQRTESPNSVYTYAVDGIIRPDGTKLILSGVDRHLKSTTNTTLAKTVTTLTTDPGGSSVVQSVRSYDELGQQIKTDFDYDVYGNVTNKREYGYQIGGQWKVRRRTHLTYINWEPYISAYMRNRVMTIEILDALQNTNDLDDVLVGKTTYGYDNYGAMGGMENYGGAAVPPGHLTSYDSTKTARGNVTGVTTYDNLAGSGVTRSSKLDIFGNMTKAQVSCCDEKSFTMTEATYWSRASQTTSGNPSAIYLTTSAGYDFNTLTTTSQTDPTNLTTTVTHDAQQNPTGFTSPTGATGSTAYNVWSAPTSKSFTYSEGGVNKTITETGAYDAWGQITQSVDENEAQTNYAYNNMGRRLTQTNPFPQGGTPGPVTSYQYDQLGRATGVTLPGGNTVNTTYSGRVVTITDQVNRKIKRETDGLGRLVKVTEQDTIGALNQETIYTYDIADRLTLVNQGDQTRAMKYNADGQLLFERVPEMSATINDGTGAMWSMKYTYTDWGAVATKQDARGVITIYAYDTLLRLTSVTYNTSGAPVVAATPTLTYNFDNVNGSATKGRLLSLAVGSGYSESYGYDTLKRVSSVTRTIDGRNYTTSFQYNTANQQTQMSYPSSRVVAFSRDSKGRLTALGSFLSAVSYDGIGQVTGLSLGNGVTESYGYDANRMQLTSQTATKSGGPVNGLMNLTYGYQASAGQMGTGSTAGNAGQLMSISGTINGTTEGASYTYDLLGQLTTSNQTSNGSSGQRRFAYDRWGNRTLVWDAVNGGNQIQSVVLQQSGGAPTNRLTSVTTSGVTANYTYDAGGNVTNDGVRAYTYDAENRISGVDNGATATYAYDTSNQRYKKSTVGATTHYVWQASQVIAEHNGSTGASIADYVYSGSRMVAKASGLNTHYFLSDRLSVRMTLNSSGSLLGLQAHLPFGEDFAESGAQEKHHFTNYERDSESGTDYAVNRQYAPNIGRFYRPDPVRSFRGDPKELNRLRYAVNDPTNKVDPKGLFAIGLLVNCHQDTVNSLEYNEDGSANGSVGFGESETCEVEVLDFSLRFGAPDPCARFDRCCDNVFVTCRDAAKKALKRAVGIAHFLAVGCILACLIGGLVHPLVFAACMALCYATLTVDTRNKIEEIIEDYKGCLGLGGALCRLTSPDCGSCYFEPIE